ncbi:hypothetical protein HB852_10100 [Listeria grandensis]|uniref:hypothetical protein n=1 Tax=Listeria grandensis TaxID=1494963 RepID=UPI00162814D0|nr:hypothetical protein [Listeria grandensis]MBC1474969.1 hypothetical protein [Listeria grandensis]
MKKVRIMILSLSCFALVSCNEEDTKGNSNRNNELKASVHTLIEAVTYNQAIKESDLIAEVRIGKKSDTISGGNNIIAKTKFESKIKKVYAGDKKNQDIIDILQDGKEGMEIENYPLFQSGETYILMLIDSGDGQTFWIKGQVNGTYFVAGNTTLKFGNSEPSLPKKKNNLDSAVIEKLENFNNKVQVLDTIDFRERLDKDLKRK